MLGEIAGGFVVLRRDWVKAHPEAARIFVEQSASAPSTMPASIRRRPRRSLPRRLPSAARTPRSPSTSAAIGVREGGLPVERDMQFWIDVLVREGKLKQGQLTAKDILLVHQVDGAATEATTDELRNQNSAVRSRSVTSPSPSPSTASLCMS